MTRTHRYETYTEPRQRTVEQLTCDVCGTVADIVALDRPNGWTTLFRTVDAQRFSWDFCSWACTYGFVTATGEDSDGPGNLMTKLEQSLAEALAKREGVTN